MAVIDYGRKEYVEDGVFVDVGLIRLDGEYLYNDRTATFALYYKGDPNPIDIQRDIPIPARKYEWFPMATFKLAYDTDYEIGCTVYKNGSWLADIEAIDVKYLSPSRIIDITRLDKPWKIQADIFIGTADYSLSDDIYLSGRYLDNLYEVELYGDEERYVDLYGGDLYSPVADLRFLTGNIQCNISLPHAGKWEFRVTNSTGDNWLSEPYILDLYEYDHSVEIIDYQSTNTGDNYGGVVTFTIKDVCSPGNEMGLEFFDYPEQEIYFSHYIYADEAYTPADVEGWLEDLLQRNATNTVTLCCVIYECNYDFPGNGVVYTNFIKKTITLPELEDLEYNLSAIRSETSPSNILISADVTSTSGSNISYIEVIRTAPRPITTIDTINVYSSSYYNTLTYTMSYEAMGFYLRVYKETGASWFIYVGTVPEYIEKILIALWEWPENEKYLLENGGATRDFRYTVWNDLVAKVSEVRIAAGYDAWNNHFANYNNTLMTDTEEGRKLTAVRYNSLKNNIGYIWSTGIEDVSSGQAVEGYEHFIKLTKALNDWINSINNG